MIYFDSISVRTKVVAAATTLVMISVLLGAYGMRQSNLIASQAEVIRVSWLPSVAQIGRLNASFRSVRMRQNRYFFRLATRSPAATKDLELVKLETDRTDAAYKAYEPMIAKGTLDEQYMKTFDKCWTTYKELWSRILRHTEANELDKASDIQYVEGQEVFDEILKTLEAAMSFNESSGRAAADLGKTTYQVVVTYTLVAMGLAALIGACVAIFLIRSVVAPLIASTATVTRLAAGETDLKVEGAQRGDEFGVLARALDVFRKGTIERHAWQQKPKWLGRVPSRIDCFLSKRQLRRSARSYRVRSAVE